MNQQTLDAISTSAKYILPALMAAVVKWSRTAGSNREKRKSKALEELEFISGFLAFKVEQRSRLVVEHAFSAHFRQKLNYEEIACLLQFLNPTKAFSLLKTCRHLVEITSEGSFAFKEKYVCARARRMRKAAYTVLYFVLAYVGLMPVFFAAKFVEAAGAEAIAPLVLWPLCLSFMAIESLKFGVRIESAERLLSEQRKPTSKLSSQTTPALQRPKNQESVPRSEEV